MRPLPLRTFLTVVYATLMAATVSGVALGYHQLLVRQVDQDATQALQDLERGLHGYLRVEAGAPVLTYDERDAVAVAFVEEATRFYQVFDATTGRRLVQSRAMQALGADYGPAEVAAFRRRPGVHDLVTERGRVRVVSSTLAGPEGGEYLLQVGLPLEQSDRSIAAVERLLMWGIAGGLVVAVLVGRWMAGRALAPLSALATATHTIDVTTLDRRLPVRGAGDELDEVATAFNATLARLDAAIGEMRQFSAAIAHELRTPLAALRGDLELALRAPKGEGHSHVRLEAQIEEIDRLNKLIGQILTLARAETGQIVLAHAPVDLAALAERTVEQLELVAEARGLTLTCDAPPAIWVEGDAGWLGRVVLILLDNAIKFTPAGGRVAVRVARTGGTAVIEVADTGQGIPRDAQPHLFERFYRADPARSRAVEGIGLGLALAKWVADRHHASLSVRSEVGHGSTFTLAMPALTRPPDRPLRAPDAARASGGAAPAPATRPPS